jgi:FkbM family methyltransferase
MINTLPRTWRITETLRQHYVQHYRGREDRWAIVNHLYGDIRMKLDRSAYMGSVLYWFGYHSRDEIHLLDELLQPEMVFADVGANQGEFTLHAARRLSSGKVLAFEPVEALFNHLEENVRLNQLTNVYTYPYALSDTPGTLKMYTSDDEEIHHSLNEGLASVFQSDERSVALGEVRVEVFDRIFEMLSLGRLDVMKIDVEGAELHVLRGAKESLREYHPTLLLEMNEAAIHAAGYTKQEVFEFLQAFNYQCFLIEPRGQVVQTTYEQLPPFCNLMCR